MSEPNQFLLYTPYRSISSVFVNNYRNYGTMPA